MFGFHRFLQHKNVKQFIIIFFYFHLLTRSECSLCGDIFFVLINVVGSLTPKSHVFDRSDKIYEIVGNWKYA